MKVNAAFLTKLLPATIVKLYKMAVEDVVTEHEVRIQELEKVQLGLPPEPTRVAIDLTNQRRMELLEEDVKKLRDEIEVLKSQQGKQKRLL